MRIIQSLVGDSAREHLHSLYFRALEKKETILTHFNGVSILFFQDNEGFRIPKFPLDADIDTIEAPYLRELDKKDPTGYEEYEKYIQRNKSELLRLRQENKDLKEAIKRYRCMIEGIG